MNYLKFESEMVVPLSFILGSVSGGILGAWVGGGIGLVVFLAIFLPIVYLTTYTDLIIKQDVDGANS